MTWCDMSSITTPVAPFALICHDTDGRIEATYSPTRGEAQQASDELAPCGPRCCGVHTIVCLDRPPRPPGE